MTTVNRAWEIAVVAHTDQMDKAGMPYFLHPERVAKRAADEVQIVALLHNVVEDTDLTLDDLRNEGFSERVLAAIDALTRREGETHRDYVLRCRRNPLAATVKWHDVADNCDPARMERLPLNQQISLGKRCQQTRELLSVRPE